MEVCHILVEALAIGQRAMQRGVYNVAVSAFEKITKYCSTDSKVEEQVFFGTGYGV